MKTQFKIIDNYLTKSYHKEIQERLTGDIFPWYYSSNSTEPKWVVGTPIFNEYGFSHSFWENDTMNGAGLEGNHYFTDNFATFIKPFLLQVMDTIGVDVILRCRADMVTWSPEEFIHPAHIDYSFPNAATIYYVNDTDGDTILYGKDAFDKDIKIDQDRFGKLRQEIDGGCLSMEIKERISPKANRLVMFDGNFLHTGSSPTQHKTRILLNSNFRLTNPL